MGESRGHRGRRAAATAGGGVSRSTRFAHAAQRAERRAELRAQLRAENRANQVGGVRDGSGVLDGAGRVGGGWSWLRRRPAAAGSGAAVSDTPVPDTSCTDTSRTDVSGAGGSAPLVGESVGESAGGDGLRRENARRVRVVERNRRRRWPWAVPGVAGLAGLGGYYASAALTVLAGAAPGVLAVPAAAVPVVAAGAFAARYRSVLGWWWPELAAGAAGASALAWGLVVSGPSPLLGVAAICGTSVVGARWWRAHPVGAGVARLEVPDPGPVAAPPAEHDPYCVAWAETNAAKDGKVPGSRLTNRVDDADTTRFDVVLRRGVHTLADLQSHRARLAGGLGEDVERVLFAPARRGEGACRARLTIIRSDPVATPRLFTSPRTAEGVICGPARRSDGGGEVDVVMWDDRGTVPTMVVGSTGGGKSAAANILTVSALSTGVLNLLYADPKGNSSTALARRARVTVIGRAPVGALPQVMAALLDARARIAADLDSDLLFPSASVPGWMVLHDEYSLVAADAKAAQFWTGAVNTVRALGVWAVALNQSQGQAQWGGDHARSAFASQVIAFRTTSKSSSELVPGLGFDPGELPLGDDGRPVPGLAVHSGVDAPVRWDWLPTDADAARMQTTGRPVPGMTATTAFEEFFTPPTPHPVDVAALTAVLGPPVNGRWQIGGRGATHDLPDNTGASGGSSGGGVLVRAPWGHRTSTPVSAAAAAVAAAGVTETETETETGAETGAEVGLSPVAVEVLALIRAGTVSTGAVSTGALVAASCGSRAAVHSALDTLIGAGLIARAGRGRYQATDDRPISPISTGGGSSGIRGGGRVED